MCKGRGVGTPLTVFFDPTPTPPQKISEKLIFMKWPFFSFFLFFFILTPPPSRRKTVHMYEFKYHLNMNIAYLYANEKLFVFITNIYNLL